MQILSMYHDACVATANLLYSLNMSVSAQDLATCSHPIPYWYRYLRSIIWRMSFS